jgi:uncharacterized membrane-anchored protein
MTALRIVLALQLAFFAAWGARLLTSHRAAETIWLETAPIDPRDLLSGHYVALRYPIASADAPGCAALRAERAGSIHVRVAASGRMIATAEGMVDVWQAVECRRQAPDAAAGQTWIAGETGSPWGRGEPAVFGIERFFVPEASPLRQARSGQVVAKVAVNEAFRARIVDLVALRTATR